MVQYWLKSCPRGDNGDLYLGSDTYGNYIACLQCGYYLTAVEEQFIYTRSNTNKKNIIPFESSLDLAVLDPMVNLKPKRNGRHNKPTNGTK